MKIILGAIVPRQSRSRADHFEALIRDYTTRAARFTPTESQFYETEELFLNWIGAQSGRVPPYLILLDSRGKEMSSEELAGCLGTLRDQGTQRVVLGVGPADGWSDHAKNKARLLLSFGRMTLPHQLARVVLAEQVYRALTILGGHPYHSGH